MIGKIDLSDRISVRLSLHTFGGCQTVFATQNDRRLMLDCGLHKSVVVDYQLSRLPARDDATEAGSALGMQLWIADQQGDVWTANAQISAGYLHDLLVAATGVGQAPKPFVDLAEVQQLDFDDGLLVTGVEYFSDERCYRDFVFRERVYSLLYKYRPIWFDVSRVDGFNWRYPENYNYVADRYSQIDGSTLLLRVRFSNDMTDNEILDDLTHFDRYRPIPSLVFELPGGDHDRCVFDLLRGNDAFCDSDYGHWDRGPFVNSLSFTKTTETGEPQEYCRVV
jgi:hypothetical protein